MLVKSACLQTLPSAGPCRHTNPSLLRQPWLPRRRYAKVTMGSIAEATRVKNTLNGVYIDELCNPGEVLLIRFARIGGAAHSSGPTSPSYASPPSRPFGRPGSYAEGGHSPRAALTPTANGGPPARTASSLPSAPSGSSVASSAAAATPPPLQPPAQRCGSCGAAESATLVLRRCSACKVGWGCWWVVGLGRACRHRHCHSAAEAPGQGCSQ